MQGKSLPIFFDRTLQLQDRLNEETKNRILESVKENQTSQETLLKKQTTKIQDKAKVEEQVSGLSTVQTVSSTVGTVMPLLALPALFARHPLLGVGCVLSSLASALSGIVAKTQWIENLVKRFAPENKTLSSYLRAGLATLPMVNSLFSTFFVPAQAKKNPQGFWEACRQFSSSVEFISSASKLTHQSQLTSLQAEKKEDETSLKLLSHTQDDAYQKLSHEMAQELAELQTNRFNVNSFLEAERIQSQPL